MKMFIIDNKEPLSIVFGGLILGIPYLLMEAPQVIGGEVYQTGYFKALGEELGFILAGMLFIVFIAIALKYLVPLFFTYLGYLVRLFKMNSKV